jgi:DNA-binding transcriptional regulator PaaX
MWLLWYNICMGKQTLTLSSRILTNTLIVGDFVLGMRGRIIERVHNPGFDPNRELKRSLIYLYKKGYISYEDKAGKRLIKLTKKGKLKALFKEFGVLKPDKWNGKWCVVSYDIPNSAAHLRFQLISHLKRLSFTQLQASVYISPYVFNAAAMEYLQSSGLMEFIRIMTVEKIDDDRDLRKKFNLH